ncbi:uncharacterized protein [Watersipora subatra]|uniref:uncharacterized protein isoform X2 n=1 Tax=Watersipora subatra TaxID=2589382 RepID=UPI00355BA6CD
METLWGEFAETQSSANDILASSDFLLESYDVTSSGIFAVPSAVGVKTEDNALSAEACSVNHGMVEHTIQLEKYRTQLHLLLGTAVQIISESADKRTSDAFANIPPFPTCNDCHKSQSKQLDTEIFDRDFIRGIGIAPPAISPATCDQLLKKSVAQICLHQGYQESHNSALESLVAACEEFYFKFLTQLRRNVDYEAMKGLSGFQDPLHRTLTQTGQGDIGALLDYHHTIVQRHDRLLTTCQQLQSAYTHIMSTGELPERLSNILPTTVNRESTMAVFSMSDAEEKEEVAAAGGLNTEELLGEEEDAQQLLELAGLSGFDITIQGSMDEPPSATQSIEQLQEPVKAKSKQKSKAKVSGAAAKRRKKH